MVGHTATDPNFTAGGQRIRYSIAVGHASGPFGVDVELWCQPIATELASCCDANQDVLLLRDSNTSLTSGKAAREVSKRVAGIMKAR